MKAISSSNSKEIKHENDLDFSVYAVIRLFSSIDSQHMVWLRNQNNNFQLHVRTLIWRPVIISYIVYTLCFVKNAHFKGCSEFYINETKMT